LFKAGKHIRQDRAVCWIEWPFLLLIWPGVAAGICVSLVIEKRGEIPPQRTPTHSQEANGKKKIGVLRSE
jgi:hypothetical protein